MPTTSSTLPDIHKIAVVRANGLGDLIFALPALTALRTAYPEAEIVYIGKPLHQAFFAGRPGPVDRVVVAPVSQGVREEPGQTPDPDELASFFKCMSAEKFDLALQLHGGGRNSNPFVLNLGARYSAGTRTPDAPPLDFWVPYVYYQREILRWLEVVALVGAWTDRIRPEVAVLQSDFDEARSVLVDEDQPFIVIHPGATDRRRQWPIERFAAVGDALADRGLAVYVTGTGNEKPLVDAVVGAMRRPVFNLCDKLPIGGMVGLLKMASLLITNDTGPMHLAEAVGSCSVGIYWGPNVITAGPMTQYNHRPQLSWILQCPLCGADLRPHDMLYEGCDHDTSFTAKVTVEDVVGAADELLGQRRGMSKEQGVMSKSC
jgi:ADP-heptose:LPS heptosyltransferase